MSDRMRPIPFDKLIVWMLEEYASEGSIFGVPKSRFFAKAGSNTLQLFGDSLENPLGPAAGPNTQLAQNIIAAYVAGSRFFELKTVQVLDGEDLPVSKPCILARDEGYNVEWSTELTVPDALNEYIKAWFALNILAKELSLGSSDGFVFNMSVGYDLEGIKSPKINNFIDSLRDASETSVWKECGEFILGNLNRFKNIDERFVEGISANICRSITLSTLHGCPPEEIERIAVYLLREKRLHTFVKCNPTLLGYEFARKTLDSMGYGYLVFDDHHFKNDLQYKDAVSMISRLKAFAKDLGLSFGVKLTNTFPVKITKGELPGEEMYMSGRALYPLTINLAYRLAEEFDGDIRISYSGGADFFNIDRIYKAGIWPITVATTILKPGGYLRLGQMAELLEKELRSPEFKGVDVEALKLLAESAVTDKNHLKSERKTESRKISKKVPLLDCFIAPCTEGCPIGQDIPEYIRLEGEGKYLEALELIIAKNPLPFTTGTLCNHRCMNKCIRIDYEEAVEIRACKLLAAEKAYGELIGRLERPEIRKDIKVAVIGAGPAGLAAAYFLGKEGAAVTVFDRKDRIGGIIEHIAPDFRISREAINNDMELIRKMGAEFRLGVDGNFSVEALKKEGFKYIFIATGAWKPGILKLDSCDRGIINVLEFLEDFNKARNSLKLGKSVAVIGGGNSAMDVARAAKRVEGVENVYLVYRRTREYMPADREELQLALEEGVEFKELLSPVAFNGGILKCQRMKLGDPDSSGRRSPAAVSGEFVDLSVDSIIAAVGEKVETELLTRNGIELDGKGRINADPETNETNIGNVFIGGDALRGPATIVEGIADGRRFAQSVLERESGQKVSSNDSIGSFNDKKQLEEITLKRGRLQKACSTVEEKDRCLECSHICNICVEVCPNRANLALRVNNGSTKCTNQVLHIDGMCNECGNCETFCPYESAPYKDKLTLFGNVEDFEDSRNTGFVLTDEAAKRFRVRLGDKAEEISFDENGKCNGPIPGDIADVIRTAYKKYYYLF